MKIIELKECRINTSDFRIIGSLAIIGLSAGFFVPQTSGMDFVACLMVGIGLGLVISSIFAKKN